MFKYFGFILLAAGCSSRMDAKPKALLPFRGTTLAGHVMRQMQTADGAPVVLVTGAHHEALARIYSDVHIVHNAAWQEGMSGSLRAGLAQMLEFYPDIEAVIVAACDQPYVSRELFARMVDKWEETNKGIIACSYAGSCGIPVLFDKRYFDAILLLQGNGGAKPLLTQFKADCIEVPFPEGEFDIDTPEEYARLLQEMPLKTVN